MSVSHIDGVNFSQKVLELREKIHDEKYLDFAIQRIAQVLSLHIVEEQSQSLFFTGSENGIQRKASKKSIR